MSSSHQESKYKNCFCHEYWYFEAALIMAMLILTGVDFFLASADHFYQCAGGHTFRVVITEVRFVSPFNPFDDLLTISF